jgi:hypothetical protein
MALKTKKMCLTGKIDGENVSFGCFLPVETRVGDVLSVLLEGKGWGFHGVVEVKDIRDSRNGYPQIEQAATTTVPWNPEGVSSRSTKERNQGHYFKLFLILQWQIKRIRRIYRVQWQIK